MNEEFFDVLESAITDFLGSINQTHLSMTMKDRTVFVSKTGKGENIKYEVQIVKGDQQLELPEGEPED